MRTWPIWAASRWPIPPCARYLAKHPDEDVVIDGLTQDQRCFLAWTQIWAWKGKDEVLRSQVARDAHPPNAYRAVAPLLHLDAFYEAFGIKEGDPMWLRSRQPRTKLGEAGT